MPTRISAGVGDHPCFLTMIPISCKITNFSLYLYITEAHHKQSSMQETYMIHMSQQHHQGYSVYQLSLKPMHNMEDYDAATHTTI